jgi:hypothetical protein
LSSEDFGISFPVQAPNFHSLFFGKKILNLNPQDWINGTRDPGFAINNFQEGCFEIGFNVGDENEIQARIGVVSKNNTGQWPLYLLTSLYAIPSYIGTTRFAKTV